MLEKQKFRQNHKRNKTMEINILGSSEVRWQGAGKMTPAMFEIFCSGGTKHMRGVAFVSDQEMRQTVVGHWPLKIVFYF